MVLNLRQQNQRKDNVSFLPNRRLAVPSWVMPGNIVDNCQFINGKANEVGLLFFEKESSLQYNSEDLPHSLSQLSLSFHIHFPTSFTEGKEAAEVCDILMKKTAFLQTQYGVLHLPKNSNIDSFLNDFSLYWKRFGRDNNQILLENVEYCDLVSFSDKIAKFDFSVCIDIGHIFAYEQKRLLSCKALLSRTKLVHLNVVGTGGQKNFHFPLTRLTSFEQMTVKSLLERIPKDATLMLELFEWKQIEESMPVLLSLLKENR